MSAQLPPLDSLTDPAKLTQCLSTLFEPSTALKEILVPQLVKKYKADGTPLSYAGVIHDCAEASKEWTWEQKSDFVTGHPLIGAPATGLSGKEQGTETTKVVLDRLQHTANINGAVMSLKQLNSLYSQAFPDLTFITFVNGRPRSEIVNEMERKIGLPESPKPLPDSFDCSSTTIDPKLVRKKGSPEWEEECDRDVNDVWRIARSRLRTLGVE
ncbi:hypothetical protein A1Q2_02295 [Trichosporon asahii var. asahii CBS 8904]|uniref:Oxo-4-hydroxy-4-carboxy-5-ureidoimidazoline decarboxylase domain-containing protein n=1 Tax=Trichosporon asahii var. asahii (strain CBS 8904) TaxID=1220162 RepID=K1W3E2_TRIAC|nr:hypothetical protein A1Q2_02295 [Trichosporon asahii var. asahii CBS 8904]